MRNKRICSHELVPEARCRLICYIHQMETELFSAIGYEPVPWEP